MNMDVYVRLLAKSFKAVTKNYKIIWIGVFFEICFFIVYGFIRGLFVEGGIGNNLYMLAGSVVSENPDLSQVFFESVVRTSYFRNIVIFALSFAILMYFVYCLFHGLIWKFYFSLSDKKRNYLAYLKKFFLVNIFWYTIFCVLVLVDFLFTYIDTVGKRVEPTGAFYLSTAGSAIMIILFYFTFISYVLIENHKIGISIKLSFKLGLKKLHWIGLTMVVIAVILYIVNYLTMLLNINFYLLIFSGILIIMPLIGWARILIKEVVDAL
jgi:hypothetical protein